MTSGAPVATDKWSSDHPGWREPLPQAYWDSLASFVSR